MPENTPTWTVRCLTRALSLTPPVSGAHTHGRRHQLRQFPNSGPLAIPETPQVAPLPFPVSLWAPEPALLAGRVPSTTLQGGTCSCITRNICLPNTKNDSKLHAADKAMTALCYPDHQFCLGVLMCKGPPLTPSRHKTCAH